MSDTRNPPTTDLPAHVALRGDLVFARHTYQYPIGYRPKPHKRNVFGAS